MIVIEISRADALYMIKLLHKYELKLNRKWINLSTSMFKDAWEHKRMKYYERELSRVSSTIIEMENEIRESW